MKIIIKERIAWIDWAKSFCMFLVILGHCHIEESDRFFSQFIYSFHMMFFFFLSGILCKRELSLSSLRKDIQFIIIPYFSYGIILMAFNFLRSRSFEVFVFVEHIKELFVGKDITIGPIWFLPALFICKQIFLLIKKIKVYSMFSYWALFVFSLFPAHIISDYNYNIPFFIDSALCGLPFFFLGNESLSFFNKIKMQKWYFNLSISIMLCCFSLFLCDYNGFVSMASCTIGKSIYVYYLNAYAAIIAFSMLFMFLDSVRFYFITILSYGSIVSLGLHGIPLTMFNYYLPIILGKEPSTYSVFIAISYSIITYIICYILIQIIDIHCPLLFGLKGNR